MGDRLRHRSEAYSSDGSMKENQLHSSPPTERVNGNRSSSSEEHSPLVKGEKAEENAENLLFGGGHCRWPGCERECSSPEHWKYHMSREHSLNDKMSQTQEFERRESPEPK